MENHIFINPEILLFWLYALERPQQNNNTIWLSFSNYGTLKFTIELKVVPTVVFVQGYFLRCVTGFLRFFGFDSAYWLAITKPANLHYMTV